MVPARLPALHFRNLHSRYRVLYLRGNAGRHVRASEVPPTVKIEELDVQLHDFRTSWPAISSSSRRLLGVASLATLLTACESFHMLLPP
jgi:hypothetical protein